MLGYERKWELYHNQGQENMVFSIWLGCDYAQQDVKGFLSFCVCACIYVPQLPINVIITCTTMAISLLNQHLDRDCLNVKQHPGVSFIFTSHIVVIKWIHMPRAPRQRVKLTKQTEIYDSFLRLPASFLSLPPTSLSDSRTRSPLPLCIFHEPSRAIVMFPSCFYGDEVRSAASESLASALLTCPNDFQACPLFHKWQSHPVVHSDPLSHSIGMSIFSTVMPMQGVQGLVIIYSVKKKVLKEKTLLFPKVNLSYIQTCIFLWVD